MAQTGFTPISIYYSSTATNVPTAGNLVAGELAINTADGKLFYKDSAGVVQVIGTKGGVGSSSTTQVLYNSSGLVVGSANMTFSGTALTLANDAVISGLDIGKGGGSVSTNTRVGAGALSSNTSGLSNVAMGYLAFNANTTGQGGIAIGSGALQNNTTGNNNAGVGINSLLTNTTGQYNSAYGTASLQSNTTGSNNVAIGYTALLNNTTASNNTAVGYQAGYSNTTGAYNTSLGNTAGNGNTTGNGGVYIGYAAGSNATTGGYNVMIGYGPTLGTATDNSCIVIGGLSSAGKGSNTGYINPQGGGVYQGNNSATWSITSDARLKKNITDNNTGLDKIASIQVRNFEYRLPEEVIEVSQDQAIQKTGVQLGAIAQEIQAILPECVKQETTGIYTVDTDPLIWYLVNAVKELKTEIDQLKGN
jgi:hypothetical protein